MKRGPFGDIKKICEKKSHKAEKNLHKKFWSRAELLLLGRPQKAVTSMSSASRSSVAQCSVSASQLLKPIKSVSSLVLKKELNTLVCVFLRKVPTKNQFIGQKLFT